MLCAFGLSFCPTRVGEHDANYTYHKFWRQHVHHSRPGHRRGWSRGRFCCSKARPEGFGCDEARRGIQRGNFLPLILTGGLSLLLFTVQLYCTVCALVAWCSVIFPSKSSVTSIQRAQQRAKGTCRSVSSTWWLNRRHWWPLCTNVLMHLVSRLLKSGR